MRVVTFLFLLYQTDFSYGRSALSKGQFHNSNQSLIVGGYNAKIRDFPFMGKMWMHFKDDEKRHCGAAILHALMLLTAAHCFLDKPESIIISIGSAYLSRGVYYLSTNYTGHSLYRHPEPDYDIGVVRTHGEMYLDKVITKPVVLADKKSYLRAYSRVTVAGWGFTYESSHTGSQNLKAVTLTVSSILTCRESYGINAKITERLFCAGEYKRDKMEACYGDSGGPALSGGVHVGIYVLSIACGTYGDPSVYVRTAAFRGWINRRAGFNDTKS